MYASLSELILFIGNARYCNINPGCEDEDSKNTLPLQKILPTTIFTIAPSLRVCVCMLSHFSCVRVCATLWIVTCQALVSMGFSRQEYWSGLPRPPPTNLPNPETEPVSLTSPALAGKLFTTNDRSMYFKAVNNYSFFSLYLIYTAAEK